MGHQADTTHFSAPNYTILLSAKALGDRPFGGWVDLQGEFLIFQYPPCCFFKWEIIANIWKWENTSKPEFLAPLHACSAASVLWPHGLQPARSSVHGIHQARTLERGAISFCRGSSQPRPNPCLPRLRQWQAGSLPLVPPWKPFSLSRKFQHSKIWKLWIRNLDFQLPRKDQISGNREPSLPCRHTSLPGWGALPLWGSPLPPSSLAWPRGIWVCDPPPLESK